MSRCCVVVSILTLNIFLSLAIAQNPPTSDPQALAFAAQSIASVTAGTGLNDVTLTGNVIWNGSNPDTGTATLKALGAGESRIDLALTSGARTEIRDAQTGPCGSVGIAFHHRLARMRTQIVQHQMDGVRIRVTDGDLQQY